MHPTKLFSLLILTFNFAHLLPSQYEIKTKHDTALAEEEAVQEGNVRWISRSSERVYPLKGFKNYDNRCYINACLQALCNNAVVHDFLDHTNQSKNSVAAALQSNSSEYLTSENCLLSSSVLKNSLYALYQDGKFSINVLDNRQEDAAEVLAKILEQITPNLSQPQTNPFCLQEVGTFTCLSCKNVYQKELDDYKFSTILSLPLTRDSLELCLHDYFQGQLEKRCQEHPGKNVLHTKNIMLKAAPPLLCIALNRFSYTNTGGSTKNMTHVTFPDNLDMHAYSEVEDPQANYTLAACVMHQGTTLDKGHYVAYAKRGNHWYLFNDAQVTQMPLGFDIKANLTENNGETAYILLYEKTNARDFVRASGLSSQPKQQNHEHQPDSVSEHAWARFNTYFFGTPRRTLLSLSFVVGAFVALQKLFMKPHA